MVGGHRRKASVYCLVGVRRATFARVMRGRRARAGTYVVRASISSFRQAPTSVESWIVIDDGRCHCVIGVVVVKRWNVAGGKMNGLGCEPRARHFVLQWFRRVSRTPPLSMLSGLFSTSVSYHVPKRGRSRHFSTKRKSFTALEIMLSL